MRKYLTAILGGLVVALATGATIVVRGPVLAKAAAGGSAPTVGVVNQAEGTDSFTSAGVTTQASGSLFLIACSFYASDPGSVTPTDSKSNTYVEIGTAQGMSNSWIKWWVCHNGTGGTGHTFSISSTGRYPTGHFIEIRGAHLTSAVELQAKATDSSSPFTQSITTTVNNRLIIHFCAENNGTGSATQSNSGWTKQTEEPDIDAWMSGAVWTRDGTTLGTFNSSVTKTDVTAVNMAICAILPP